MTVIAAAARPIAIEEIGARVVHASRFDIEALLGDPTNIKSREIAFQLSDPALKFRVLLGNWRTARPNKQSEYRGVYVRVFFDRPLVTPEMAIALEQIFGGEFITEGHARHEDYIAFLVTSMVPVFTDNKNTLTPDPIANAA